MTLIVLLHVVGGARFGTDDMCPCNWERNGRGIVGIALGQSSTPAKAGDVRPSRHASTSGSLNGVLEVPQTASNEVLALAPPPTLLESRSESTI